YALRGRIFDQQLAELRMLWRRPDLGPQRGRSRPKLLLGGGSDLALLRLARYADGYVHNGGPARGFRSAADRVMSGWSDLGRPGRPELWGLGYFALGPGAYEEGRRDLLAYYAFTGGFVSRIAAGLLASPEAVRDFTRDYAESGCDHLILFPTVARLEQVERLAEAVWRLWGETDARKVRAVSSRVRRPLPKPRTTARQVSLGTVRPEVSGLRRPARHRLTTRSSALIPSSAEEREIGHFIQLSDARAYICGDDALGGVVRACD